MLWQDIALIEPKADSHHHRHVQNARIIFRRLMTRAAQTARRLFEHAEGIPGLRHRNLFSKSLENGEFKQRNVGFPTFKHQNCCFDIWIFVPMLLKDFPMFSFGTFTK